MRVQTQVTEHLSTLQEQPKLNHMFLQRNISTLKSGGYNHYPTAVTLASSYSSYSSQFNPSNQGAYLRSGVTMSNDGLKFIAINEYSSNNVYEYDLTTAYDLSTAGATAVDSFDPPNTYAGDISFSPDGTNMYLVTTSNNRIIQYTLSTPFDISTRGSATTYDPSINVYGAKIVNAGSTMFTQGYSSTTSITLTKFTLSTPYDLSGTVTNNGGVTLSASTIGVTDVRGYGGDWSEDGKQFIHGTISGTNDLFTIDFATAYDLNSTKTYNVANAQGRPGAVKVVDNGTKMIWGDETASVFRLYNI